MSVVPILTVPNKKLEQTAEKVRGFNDETKKVIQDMLDTLRDADDPEGAGLAAPQIGVMQRIIIARRFFPNPENSEDTITKEHVFVNPKVISSSKETDLGLEGCLSILDTYGMVERPRKVKIKALNENGEPIRKTVTGFFGRVVQHEIDHLDGILFTDKVIGKIYTEEDIDNMSGEESK
jgi:peptide deformylase